MGLSDLRVQLETGVHEKPIKYILAMGEILGDSFQSVEIWRQFQNLTLSRSFQTSKPMSLGTKAPPPKKTKNLSAKLGAHGSNTPFHEKEGEKDLSSCVKTSAWALCGQGKWLLSAALSFPSITVTLGCRNQWEL